MRKFPLLRDRLLAEGIVAPANLFEPEPIGIDLLRPVHSEDYLAALARGTLTRDQERRLGLPWSEALWRRSRLATAGTLCAAEAALAEGLAANLAGGTHHAHPDAGEGFCVLNDTAVAIHCLRSRRAARRFLVIDLDVHQGNGNSACLAGDPETFTFSMHGERNFPLRKIPSTLDVGLPDHTGDLAYLDTLAAHLPQVIERARPDLAFYLAGVDVVVGDRYGRLALTREGLRQRDRLVCEALHGAGIPTVLTLAGGYAKTPELTADLHATVHREAVAVW
jgi:acetoin utilization deacetylase AcuC-like enzyme